MYKLVSLLCVVCFAASAFGAAINVPQIVGGRDAPEGKYPYQASIRNGGRHLCGASIISERYLLTAAHCLPVNPTPDQLIYLKIHVGTNYVKEAGIVYDIESIVRHKDFNTLLTTNDIGLIRVTKNIEFNEKVQPISLAKSNFVTPGAVAILTGWGRLWAGGSSPNNLQEIELNVVSNEVCKRDHRNVVESHICTLTKVGEGACHGDSGSPLVVNGIQVGIVSYGRPCAVGSPDVYTRVFSFQKWVKENSY